MVLALRRPVEPRGSRGTAPPKKNGAKPKPRGGGGGGGSRPGNRNNNKNKNKNGGNKNGNRGGNAPMRPKSARLLNPPFDARMRRIGSPLNQADQIKRGWILHAETLDRVNFLYNPSDLGVEYTMDSTVVDPTQAPMIGEAEGTHTWYVAGGSLSFKLLYDRTYEVWSRAGTGQGPNAANKFGVYADVVAWYIYLDMMDDLPADWNDTRVLRPMSMHMSHLFIGPRMVFYGYPNRISVTYSHWTQNMVPVRCAVDIGFLTVPYEEFYEGRYDDPREPGNQLISPGGSWRDGVSDPVV